jgi:hypothetical protein
MTTLNAALFVLPFLALPVSALWGGAPAATAAWGRAVLVVLALRVLLAWRFSYPWWTALATPVAVLALIGIQFESYVRHLTGRPVFWRAREYSGAAPVGRG